MDSPKISVIVPVYNVEQYLPRCINSILAQTFTDFELLLIDDGSTDSSGKICDEYAEKDNRIRVFHKENGGVASARQFGIEQAVGKYSIHADGDDWTESLMLEKMYNRIVETNADVVIADFYQDARDKSKYISQTTRKTSSLDILIEILKGNLFGALWNKLILHSLYKENNIHFVPGINYCEDVLVLSQIFLLKTKVVFLHNAFYHYDQQNLNSITRNYTRQTFYARQKFVKELMNLLPVSFADVVVLVAFKTKREAFFHGVLEKKDFYEYSPTPLSCILSDKYKIDLKICMILAYLKCFGLAKFLWKYYMQVKNALKPFYNRGCKKCSSY